MFIFKFLFKFIFVLLIFIGSILVFIPLFITLHFVLEDYTFKDHVKYYIEIFKDLSKFNLKKFLDI